MLTKEQVGLLAADFKSWGLDAVKLIQENTMKYGVLCSATRWSDGEKG
jgi:hypothetical protein